MTNSNFKLKLEVLYKEWEFAKKDVARIDTLVFSIRGWAISLVTGLTSYSFLSGNGTIALYGLIPILMFWYLDGLFKSFQRNFLNRIEEIEGYLASDEFQKASEKNTELGIATPDTIKHFKNRKGFPRRLKAVIRASLIRNVVSTYLFMTIVVVLAAHINS